MLSIRSTLALAACLGACANDDAGAPSDAVATHADTSPSPALDAVPNAHVPDAVVVVAGVDGASFAHGCPDPTALTPAWQRLDVGAAWAVTRGAPDTVVALIDGGLDPFHPDLLGQLAPGQDFVDGDQTPFAFSPHATALASLLVGTGVGDDCVRGLCPSCRLMPLRVPTDPGIPELAALEPSLLGAAVDWAVAHGADVIVFGVESSVSGPELDAAVARALAAGVPIVAPAGNGGLAALAYPAALPGVISVAALHDTRDFPLPTTNLARGTTIGAPAGAIPVASYGASYAAPTTAGETSVAAAIVGGTLALARTVRPTLTPAALGALLRATALPLEAPELGARMGFGRLDVGAAVEAAGETFGGIVVRATRVEPRRPKAGQAAIVHGLVENDSDHDVAAADVTLALTVDGEEVATTTLVGAPLAPAEARAWTLAWPADRVLAGSHTVRVNGIDVVDWRPDPDAVPDPGEASSGVVIIPWKASPIEVVTGDTHDLEVERLRPIDAPVLGLATRQFEATIVNRGSVAETFSASATLDETPLGTTTLGPLAPGDRTTLAVTVQIADGFDGDLPLEVAVQPVAGETELARNRLAASYRFEPHTPRTRPAWADVYGTDVFVDAPYRVDAFRPFVPVVVHFTDLPGGGLSVPRFRLCAADRAFDCAAPPGTLGHVADKLGVYEESNGQVLANDGVTIVDDLGDTVSAPFLPSGMMRGRRFRTWHRILRVPLANLPRGAEGVHLHAELWARYANLEYGEEDIAMHPIRRGLRVRVDLLPHLQGRPDDHYFDAHYHTMAEWTENEVDVFSPQKAFGGPPQMLIDAAYAHGFLDSLDTVKNRLTTTDHSVYFTPNEAQSYDVDWCTLYGQAGTCGGADPYGECPVTTPVAAPAGCGELAKMRATFGRAAGEEVTIADGPDCVSIGMTGGTTGGAGCIRPLFALEPDIEVSEGYAVPIIGALGIQVYLNFGMHLLTFDAPHIDGPWHGGAQLSWDPGLFLWAVERFGIPPGKLLLNRNVIEPNQTARLGDVLGKLAANSESPTRRPFAYAAHPYTTNDPTSWRRRDLRHALGLADGARDRRYVAAIASPEEQFGFVFRGLQVWNDRSAWATSGFSVAAFADLNPWLSGHPTQFRAMRPPATVPDVSACETRTEPPLQSPSWDQAVNLSFCNWLGFIEQGLRYNFDGDDRVFVRKIFGIAGSDSHGDFNYTTSTKAALATMFAGWDGSTFVGMVENAEVMIDALAAAHPPLLVILTLATGKVVGGLSAVTRAHLDPKLAELAGQVGPQLFSAAFGAARTLALVEPADVAAGEDRGELAVAALRAGRAAFGDGPMPFMELDAQPLFDAKPAADGRPARYDASWDEPDDDAVDGTCLPDAGGGDPLLTTIETTLSADGKIGGRGTFDAEGTVLVPVLARLGLGDYPLPVLRFRVAHGDGHGGTLTSAKLWRIKKDQQPEVVELPLPEPDLNGERCFVSFPLEAATGPAVFGEDALPAEAVVMQVTAKDKAGPSSREEVYRGYTNPIWIAPVRVDRRDAVVGTQADGTVALTELELVLDFPISMGGLASARLYALDHEGKSQSAVLATLEVAPDERDSPLAPAVAGGRMVLRLPAGSAVPLDALEDFDLVSKTSRPDQRALVVVVAGPYDAMGASDSDLRARNVLNDFAIPIRLQIGHPGVVYTELPSHDVPPGGPLRLADPATGEIVTEDLLAALTDLDPTFGPQPIASALGCDAATDFIAALVPRPGATEAELCLYRRSTGWACTGRTFPGSLDDGIRRVAVAEDLIADPAPNAHPGAQVRRLTVAFLDPNGDVSVRRFLPDRPRDPASDPEPDVPIVVTPWREEAFALTPDGAQLLTLDARPDDPTDPTTVTAIAGDATATVNPPGGTAKAGLDVYRWPGTTVALPQGAGQLLTPEKVPLAITVRGFTVNIGDLPPIFWDPTVTARGSFLATSDLDAWADYLTAAPGFFGTPGAQPDLATLSAAYGFDVFERPLAGGTAANLTPATTLAFPNLAGAHRGMKTCPALTEGGDTLLFAAGALIPGAASPKDAEIQWDLFTGPVGGPFKALTHGQRGVYLCGCWLR